ncbi:hypothetical protein EYM_06660 [Ignicoccus islandicus DSM 13165]|uniref:Uncharacterized protein n=1 Tax=Ignicoccus islandicus DSM 13165 TaxID=940295 RepID=A0A0U3F560_9CREN|nr:hypothetical protein [Ignicoccus islandicus]ALU12709.1 hypothetical protein EYM_06660 [Ignicoccus islandicus DSM 13165]
MQTADNRKRLVEERRAVLEYLALKALANRKDVLQALYDYLVNNESPSEASKKYNVQKAQLKSAAYQLVSKARPPLVVKLLKLAMPFLLEIEPIVEEGYCKICHTPIHTNHAEPHIAVKHQDIIKKTALELEEKIKASLKAKKLVRATN